MPPKRSARLVATLPARPVPPGCGRRDEIENVANLAEGENRDPRTNYREAAYAKEGQQQSACHAEPGRPPRADRDRRTQLAQAISQGAAPRRRQAECEDRPVFQMSPSRLCSLPTNPAPRVAPWNLLFHPRCFASKRPRRHAGRHHPPKGYCKARALRKARSEMSPQRTRPLFGTLMKLSYTRRDRSSLRLVSFKTSPEILPSACRIVSSSLRILIEGSLTSSSSASGVVGGELRK